jgi:hypothetical protein
MTFRLQRKNEPRLTWVDVNMDMRDGKGRAFKVHLRANVLIPSREEIKALIGVDADPENINDDVVLRKVLYGWDDVEDENSNVIEFECEREPDEIVNGKMIRGVVKQFGELTAEVLDTYPVGKSIVKAWFDVLGKMGLRKN